MDPRFLVFLKRSHHLMKDDLQNIANYAVAMYVHRDTVKSFTAGRMLALLKTDYAEVYHSGQTGIHFMVELRISQRSFERVYFIVEEARLKTAAQQAVTLKILDRQNTLNFVDLALTPNDVN